MTKGGPLLPGRPGWLDFPGHGTVLLENHAEYVLTFQLHALLREREEKKCHNEQGTAPQGPGQSAVSAGTQLSRGAQSTWLRNLSTTFTGVQCCCTSREQSVAQSAYSSPSPKSMVPRHRRETMRSETPRRTSSISLAALPQSQFPGPLTQSPARRFVLVVRRISVNRRSDLF